MAGTTGLEPATSDVTGRRSNQLNYVPACVTRDSSIVARGRRRFQTGRLSRFAAIHPFQIEHEGSNWLGIARREPGLRDRKVSPIAARRSSAGPSGCAGGVAPRLQSGESARA